MNTTIDDALQQGGIADITTIGRRSGVPRRIEIYFHHFDGDFFLTGRPGLKRDWLANMRANPNFTLHLKRGVHADLPAVADPIDEAEQRREVLYRILTESWGTDPAKAQNDLAIWVDGAPLVRFSLDRQ